MTNLGPGAVTGATANFQVPAGYAVESVSVSLGSSYDSATGIWTMGSIGSSELTFGLRVNPTGPYDLVATITGSSAPDPNLANNTVAVTVTPNPDADLRISFNSFNIPTGTVAYGSSITWSVSISNDGPAGTTGVTARALLPAGYTFTSANVATGTYNATTGDWTIGSIPFFSGAGLTRRESQYRAWTVDPLGDDHGQQPARPEPRQQHRDGRAGEPATAARRWPRSVGGHRSAGRPGWSWIDRSRR